MKVAIVCGAGIVSGKEIISLELGDALRAENEEVLFVMSSWGAADFRERLQSRGIKYYSFRLGFISATMTFDNIRMTLHQLLYWPKLLLDYFAFLRRENPDRVIHTNWHHLLVLLPFLNSERDVFWVHDFVPNTGRYARLFAIFSRRLRGFVTVSTAVAEAISRLEVPGARICVIHNGIADPSSGQSIVAIPRSEIGIGIVGQIGAWKGHEDLLEAFLALAPRFPMLRLHIFGETDRPFVERLKNRAEQGGVGPRLSWHGYVKDRSAIYPLIDVCGAPTRTDEPLGLTAIEAAFFGLPVVATRKGGLPEIVVDGDTGYLVEPENPGQLADRLGELVSDPDLRRSMGAAGRERALRCFACTRMAKDFQYFLRSGNQEKRDDHRVTNARPAV